MIEDFEFDTETSTFTETTSESILPEVVFRLHAQAAGNRGIAGQPPHRGDWFMRPGFGNRCHEARTMSPDIEKQMIGYVNAALSPMVGRRGVVGVEVQVVGRTKNGITLSTEVKLSGGTNKVIISCNCNSSLSTPSITIRYKLEMHEGTFTEL